MTRHRVPNVSLRSLLDEAGWTGERLAREVNIIGAESGTRLCYGRASVSQWLSGVRPRELVRGLVAEAFSRRLSRRVTTADAGWRAPSETDVAWWKEDPLTWLTELGADRNAAHDKAERYIYSVDAVSVPAWEDAVSTGVSWPRRNRGRRRIGAVEVASAGSLIPVFSDADKMFGGGYARLVLAKYLTAVIVPWLDEESSPGVRRELMSVAAKLAYLCGFMCFDSQLSGAAQRYYLAALRLAAETGDVAFYAVTLRALSAQARMLAHRQHAVQLAELAERVAAGKVPNRTAAFLLGQLAVSYAASGDRHRATKSLLAAERRLGRSDDRLDPVGAYHLASLCHQRAAVYTYLGDRHTAAQVLGSSLRSRPTDERRSRAITLARLAELQASCGKLESACRTWHTFLDDYPFLVSRRADAAVVTLRASIRPHLRQPFAQLLDNRVSELITAPCSPDH